MTDFMHKKVALLGFGSENKAVFGYIASKGAEITICDQREALADLPEGVATRLGKEYLQHLTDFNIIVRSPGIPYLTREIQLARQAGAQITSQTKLFLEACPSQIIGVTGTKGKSTTTALIANILQQLKTAKEMPGNVYAAGNIGLPPVTLLERLTKDDWVVLELSSFQLQDVTTSPHIAVVLNVSIDHLDHHRDEAEYISAKKNIVRYQKPDDALVVHLDSLTSTMFADETPATAYFYSREKSVDHGAYVERALGDDHIVLRMPGQSEAVICKVDEVPLVGPYNLENVTAAITAAALAGAGVESIKNGVVGFAGLAHRLQLVAETAGVRYYDDSKSTTPDSTIAAILSFDQPVILIVGGSSKGADFTELVEQITSSQVRSVITLGPEGEQITRLLEEYDAPQTVVSGGTMQETVLLAAALAEPGDVVLLSPAAASFHAFKSAEDRGDQFQAAVRAL
jgi:UDP-N-acetylmuramoylalanine--D-glutamate ligase